MWHYFSVLSLFLLLERGHQTFRITPLNQENAGTCTDTCHPHDCAEVHAQGYKENGIYLIYPAGPLFSPMPVFCDMTSEGGPWTVIQKRFDGSVNFFRGWADYKAGFGQANGEHWLGLKNIHQLARNKPQRLRIDLEDFERDHRFVVYSNFSLSPFAISPEEDGYRLYVDGFEEGDPDKPAGDCFSGFSGVPFSTYDYDRDAYVGNCAKAYQGAFWYTQCHNANLNGKYLHGPTKEYAAGIVWSFWKGYYYSLKGSEMKIAPAGSYLSGSLDV